MAEYIDKKETEKVIEEIMLFIRKAGHGTPEQTKIYIDGLGEGLYQVQMQQTADVVEVVHGRWEPDAYMTYCSCGKSYKTTHFVCSVCNRVSIHQPYGLTYCPNCGAKMDGKEGQNAN